MNKFRSLRILILLVIAGISSINAQGQLSFESERYGLDSIDIKIKASNLSQVGAVTLKIQVDTTKVIWGRLITNLPELNGSIAGRNKNIITIAWDDVAGFSVGDAVLYTMRFGYSGGQFIISFDRTSSELADINGNTLTITFHDLTVTHISETHAEQETAIISLYPNPANPRTVLEVYTENSVPGSVKVFSITGQLLEEIYRGDFPIGVNRFYIEQMKIANQVLFVEIILDNKRFIKKLLFIK